MLDDQLDRALLLARQGVALDDTVRTRGNLLGALLRSPAAIGVIRADHAAILSAAVSPDGGTLAVGNIAGEVLLFDTRTRRRIATVEPTPNEPAIYALAYSPDGSRLAVAHTSIPGASADYPAGWRILVALVDTRSRRVVERLAMPRELAVGGVQFSPDGRTLGVTLYADNAGSLMRFDVRTGRRSGAPVPVELHRRLTVDPFQVWPRSPVAITSDGRQLVVGAEDGVTVRDAATLSVLKRFPAAGKAAIRPCRPPTRSAATTGRWRSAARTARCGSSTCPAASCRPRPAGIAPPSTRRGFTPNGRTLVTAGEDGDVILWDVRQAAAAETLSGHARSAFSPQIADHGKTLYTASLDGTVLIWDLVGRRRLGQRFAAGAGNDFAPRYALSSDGRLLAHGQADGAISLVDMRTLTALGAFPVVRNSGVEGIGFVPGSHLLVVGGAYGSVSLVDADRGHVVKQLYGHPAHFRFRGRVTDNPIWTPGISADGEPARHREQGRHDQTLVAARRPRTGRPAAVRVRGRRRAAQPQRPLAERRRAQSRRRAGPTGDLGRPPPSAREDPASARRRRLRTVQPRRPVPGRRRSARARAGVRDGDVEAGHAVVCRRQGGLGRVHPRRPHTRHREHRRNRPPVGRRQRPGARRTAARHPQLAVVPIFTPDDTHLIAAYQNGRAYRWDIRPASLGRQACRVAGRRLTRAEWDEFLPGRPYHPAC